MINYICARTQNAEIINWVQTTMKKYIETNNVSIDRQGELEHIIDYLESRRKPLKLRRMSMEQALRLSKEWTKRLEKKGQDIKEKDGDVLPFLEFEKTGFKIVQLVGDSAFKREGALMRHCVGSYYGKEGVKIYSLRDPLNNPHCTIEITEDESIQQIKGKGNGPIHPDYINFIVAFLKKLGLPVRSSELQNLGYEEVSPDLKKYIESVYGKNYFKYFILNKITYISKEEAARLG